MSEFSILAIAGSLRAGSLNGAMLRMAARCAPPGIRVRLFGGMGELPPFNPDLDPAALAPVVRLHDAIRSADALLIASPEYAHGISSVTKTALDWLVADGVLVGKPVALWSPSARAQHAPAALRATLSVMLACLVEPADLTMDSAAWHGASAGANPAVLASMRDAMRHLARVRARADAAPAGAIRDRPG